tara:strand:- start:393 stop:1625 length:1233 start_codon:yes stop_codon:yes gene_type:complete
MKGEWNDYNYLDLRTLKTYVIDSEDTKEKDDAISYEKINGKEYIWVHIANPTEYIKKDDELDKIAYSRLSTLYLVEKTIYMLPILDLDYLSGFSIERTTKALSMRIELDETGEIKSYYLTKTIIKPTYILNYYEVEEVLDLQPLEESDLIRLNYLTKLRRNQRRNKGAILIHQIQGTFTKSNTNPELVIKEKLGSNLLVEECMILMGNVIALHSAQQRIPLIYRVQAAINIPNRNINIDENIYNSYLKRILKKASYSSLPEKHFSLSIDSYTHCTSPIRRYVDLIVHRQITSYLNGEECYSNDTMREITKNINNRYLDNIILYRDEQKECAANWFMNRKSEIWNTNFIMWLRKSDNIMVVKLNEIEIDIVCCVRKALNYKLGDHLLLKYYGYDSENRNLIFDLIKLNKID